MSFVRQKRRIRIEVAKRIVKRNLSSKRFKSASPDAISEMFDSAPSEGESIELTTEEDFEDDDCDNSLDLNSQDDHEQHSCFEYESCWAHSDVMMPVETQAVNAVGVEVSSDKFLPLSLHNALEENSVAFDSTLIKILVMCIQFLGNLILASHAASLILIPKFCLQKKAL